MASLSRYLWRSTSFSRTVYLRSAIQPHAPPTLCKSRLYFSAGNDDDSGKDLILDGAADKKDKKDGEEESLAPFPNDKVTFEEDSDDATDTSVDNVEGDDDSIFAEGHDMFPREVVAELDRNIVGQDHGPDFRDTLFFEVGGVADKFQSLSEMKLSPRTY